MAENAWRETRIIDLTRQIDSLKSEIQIGGYQVNKRLLKARKKILEESIDRIGTHQFVCSKENFCEKTHLKDFAVKSASIEWYLLAILFLVDSIWNPLGFLDQEVSKKGFQSCKITWVLSSDKLHELQKRGF